MFYCYCYFLSKKISTNKWRNYNYISLLQGVSKQIVELWHFSMQFRDTLTSSSKTVKKHRYIKIQELRV